MSKQIPERVSIAIEKSGLDDDEIAELVNKSQSTVNRWRNKKVTSYPKTTLKDIAYALRVDYSWLRHGEGEMTHDAKIQEIARRVNEKGESYKGLDQTLSDVESKANSLIQDLKSLVYDLRRLRSED